MTIANGSFETQAAGNQPGAADGWTVSETYTGEEFAEFTVEIVPAGTRTSAQEGFEGEWPAGYSDGLLDAFEGYFVDLEPAFYDLAGFGDPTAFEDFENLWGTAPQGVYDLDPVPIEVGSFDTLETTGAEDVEDLEEGWPAGAVLNPSFDGAELSFGDFGGAGGAEDLEQGWVGHPYNWTFPAAGVGTELELAAFWQDDATQDDFESFEGVRFDLVGVTVDPGTDTFTFAAHGLTNLWVVTIENETGRRPEGILSTPYFVRNVAANTFQLSATTTSPIIDVTDYGFGEHFLHHDPRRWWTEELVGV